MRLGPIVVALAALVAPRLLAAIPPPPRASLEATCGKGDSLACSALAGQLQRGEGGPRDLPRARTLYHKA